MSGSNGGLTPDHVDTVRAALRTLNATELLLAYASCVELQESTLRLLLQEMFSTRLDVIYWDRFRKSSPWEKLLTRVNSRVYRTVFKQHDLFDILNHDGHDIIHYMESLRCDFGHLAMFLGEVQLAGAHLKEVYHQANSSAVLSLSDRLHLDSPPQKSLAALTQQNLVSYLDHMIRNISKYIPQLQLANNLAMIEMTDLQEMDNGQLLSTAQSLLQSLQHLQQSRIQQVAYPLGITTIRCHRPSYFERYWLRNLLVTLGGIYAANIIVPMIQSGELRRQAQFLLETIKSKLQDRIVEPLKKLSQQLFDTIHKGEHIVAREDMEQSKAALDRMLIDFGQSRKGSKVIIPSIKKEVLEKSHSIFGKGNGRSDSNNDPQPIGEITTAITSEQAWTALMREYERELQTPITGMIYGNLFTAMLIQMQKLKVHTEAAMLTMDQILASNELTITATAAMPAFLLLGVVIVTVRNWLRPRAESPGVATQHFRLILGDVERSVAGLITAIESRQQQQGGDRVEDIQKQRGFMYFNLARLRSKFNELFYQDTFPVITSAASSLSAMSSFRRFARRRPSLYKLAEQHSHPHPPIRSLTATVVKSAWAWMTEGRPISAPIVRFMMNAHDLIQSVYLLLFGPHEQLSGTSLHNSLEQDVLLLESPESEVSLARKLQMIQSMRMTYKCFAADT